MKKLGDVLKIKDKKLRDKYNAVPLELYTPIVVKVNMKLITEKQGFAELKKLITE